MTQELRNKVVRKLLMKSVIGNHKKQVDTVKGWFPSDEQDDVVEIIEEFVRGGELPLYKYGGGGRDNIHLDGAYDAVEYLYEHDGIDGELAEAHGLQPWVFATPYCPPRYRVPSCESPVHTEVRFHFHHGRRRFKYE